MYVTCGNREDDTENVGMNCLKYPLLRVRSGTALSCGGSQMFSEDGTIRRCGCGPVAALNTVRYLQRGWDDRPLERAEHNEALKELCRRYFPLIPPFGINGPLFVLGLNRLMRDMALPYRASLMFSGDRLWPRIEEMLGRDLPVILTIGNNFPFFWEKHRLPFYTKAEDGSFRRGTSVKAHFVTATGIDEDRLRISSWGREYYIDRREYDAYTKEHSTYLLSNIVYLRRI